MIRVMYGAVISPIVLKRGGHEA